MNDGKLRMNNMFGAATASEDGVDGRTHKANLHLQPSVRFEWTDGTKRISEGNGTLNGHLLGQPAYFPDKGIQFVFQGAYCKGWGHWVWGDWEVSLIVADGCKWEDLYLIWCHLCDCKLVYIRIGPEIKRIEVEPAEIIGREPPPVS